MEEKRDEILHELDPDVKSREKIRRSGDDMFKFSK